jgi:hypothetical protein
MLIKVIIIVMLLLILYNLSSGLFYLLYDRGQSNRMVKALGWRIGLSLILFCFIIVAFALGLITPHSH